MTQLWHFTAASAAINYAAMVYDADDRPLSKSTAAGTSVFGYDLCDRILTELDPINGQATFGYDLAGRRTSMVTPAGKYSYNYDAADELMQQNAPTGSISYGYDLNGSRVLQKSSTASTTYLWDAANRLSAATLPSGQIYTQLYRYDDMRISESSPAGLATMIWTGLGSGGQGLGNAGLPDVLGVVNTQYGAATPMQQVFALGSGTEQASSGTPSEHRTPNTEHPSLVRALGIHASGSAINRNYHADNQGGILALSGASGTVETDYHTDSWGNVASGTAVDNPYIYLGGLGYWEDSNLSLNYVRARWQEPSTGSWLSVDSVRTEPRYAYAHNRPTIRVDASGRQSTGPIIPGLGFYQAIGSGINRIRTDVHAAERCVVHGAQQVDVYVIGLATAAISSAYTNHQNDIRVVQLLAGMSSLDLIESCLFGYTPHTWRELVEHVAKAAERANFAAVEAHNIKYAVAAARYYANPQDATVISPERQIEAQAERIKMPLMLDPVKWNEMRNTLPPDLQPFMPPHPLSPDGLRWLGGYAWAAWETAASAVHALGFVVQHPITAIKAVFKALAERGLFGLIYDCVSDQWHELRQKFTDLAHARAVYEQGEAAGMLAIEVISILVLIATSITGIAEIVDLIGASVKLVTSLVKIALKEGLAAAAKEAIRLGLAKIAKTAAELQRAFEHVRTTIKKGIQNLKPGTTLASSLGRLFVDDDLFSEKEYETVKYLRQRGENIVHNPMAGNPNATYRAGDAIMDDAVETELKTLKPGADSASVRNTVGNSQRREGQGRRIIIDARGSGLSEEEARRGIRRAFGASRGKIDRLRVFTENFDITVDYDPTLGKSPQ
jgi:RHS repeat-associated protein